VKNFYLRASPWQIFALFAVLYVADRFLGVSLIGTGPVPISRIPAATMFAVQAAGLLVIAAYLAWFWAAGSFLHSLVKPPLRLSLGFFQFALVFPVLYGIVFPFLSFPACALNFYVLLPIHVFVMFCLFYVFRFVAKGLVLQRETRYVVFRDYASLFFLMWFFPFTV
jgi:hypothetical protein